MKYCLQTSKRVFECLPSVYLWKDTFTDMRLTGIIFAICLMILAVENSILPINYLPIQPTIDDSVTQSEESEENAFENLISLQSLGQKHREDFGVHYGTRHIGERKKKSCSVVVLSNAQNPIMQTLLRKYRYDANGVLIPSSVQYFIKLPQGFGSAPILVPLNDKAFSPLGGFVRYYKEVPPIPQSW